MNIEEFCTNLLNQDTLIKSRDDTDFRQTDLFELLSILNNDLCCLDIEVYGRKFEIIKYISQTQTSEIILIIHPDTGFFTPSIEHLSEQTRIFIIKNISIINQTNFEGGLYFSISPVLFFDLHF